MIDRTHDPRVMDIEEVALRHLSKKEEADKLARDSWRRFWGGLSVHDQQFLKSVIEQDGYK